MDMDKTVDPELYSTTVLVLPGTTLLLSKFKASEKRKQKLVQFLEIAAAGLHTWHGLDVVGGMHGHHLGVYAHTISAVWVEALGDFNERQRRRCGRVKVVANRVRSLVDVQRVRAGHDFFDVGCEYV